MRTLFRRILTLVALILALACAMPASAESGSGGAAQAETDSSFFDRNPFILLGAMIVIVGRSYLVNRKYRKKYLKPYVRKRRSFIRSYNEEDEYRRDLSDNTD